MEPRSKSDLSSALSEQEGAFPALLVPDLQQLASDTGLITKTAHMVKEDDVGGISKLEHFLTQAVLPNLESGHCLRQEVLNKVCLYYLNCRL